MTKLADKPGRQMRLDLIVDRDRDRVQIIRNLAATHGCMCDSGNMGWMTMAEFRQFCEKGLMMAGEKAPTLFEQFQGRRSNS